MNTIQWIIFDIGGVLLRLNKNYRLDFLNKIEKERSIALSQEQKALFIGEPDRNILFNGEAYIEGKLETTEMIKLHRDFFNQKITDDDVIALYMSQILSEDTEVVSVLNELALHYRTACFSNTHDLHWRYITERFLFMDIFQETFASHILGISKPKEAAFLKVAEFLKTPPASCIFIDDLVANAQGAQKAGMKAIHFSNKDALKLSLQQILL
jgi:glucose-1-phosphatase